MSTIDGLLADTGPLGRNESAGQTEAAGTPTLIGGQTRRVTLLGGDRVFLAASALAENSDAAGRVSLFIRETDPAGTQTTLCTSDVHASDATEQFSMALGPIFRGPDVAEGPHLYELMFNRAGAGTAKIEQSNFCVMKMSQVANKEAKNNSSGNQGSAVAPMGKGGASCLEQRGPFAPSA